MATSLTLPSVEEVEAADEKLASALSDLDAFAMRVKAIDGPVIEPEEAVRMIRENIPFPEQPPFDFDAEAFARLLVFADEALDDAETLGDYASKLRADLLWLYEQRVRHEQRTAGRAGAEADDA